MIEFLTQITEKLELSGYRARTVSYPGPFSCRSLLCSLCKIQTELLYSQIVIFHLTGEEKKLAYHIVRFSKHNIDEKNEVITKKEKKERERKKHTQVLSAS